MIKMSIVVLYLPVPDFVPGKSGTFFILRSYYSPSNTSHDIFYFSYFIIYY